MDHALRKLYLCHAPWNAAIPQCGMQHRTKVMVNAAAAPSPLTQTQRSLLHTAVQRSRGPREQVANGKSQQQQQQLSHQELQLRANVLQLQQLVRQTQLGHQLQQQLAEQQQRDAQPVPVTSEKGHSSLPTADSSAGPQRQASSSTSASATPSPANVQLQQQQQQLLQQQLLLQQLLKQQQVRQRRLQLQLRSEPAVLTVLIKRCQSWQHLQHLFNTYTEHFNAVHVSAALTHLAQLHGPTSPTELDQQPEGLVCLMRDLTSAAAACIPDYGPRQLANTIWSICKLGCGNKVPKRLRNSYLTAFLQKLPAAAPQHISNVAWAVGSMGWGTGTQLQQRLLKEADKKLQYFKPQELSNFLYALPMLQIQPSNQWLSDYLGVCYNNLYSFNSQELSMLGIALVRLKQQPSQQWLEGYLRAVQLQLEATVAVGDTAITSHSSVANSITNHSSNTSSSSSSHASESSVSRDHQEPEQAQQPQQEQDQAAASSDSSEEPSGFQPQGLVNVLWVLAVWRVQPDTAWQGSCLAAVRHSAGCCSIQGISTLLWALTRLQIPASTLLLEQLLQHAQPLLPSATATDLALLLWSCGTLGLRCPHSSSSTAADSDSRVSRSGSSSSRGNATWLRDLLYYSRRRLPEASVRDLVSLLNGIVRLNLRPDARWLHAVAVEAHHHLASMNSIELSSILLCLARLGYQPHSAFMASYCSCSMHLLRRAAAARSKRVRHKVSSPQQATSIVAAAAGTVAYHPRELANTIGALAMLECQPPQAWSKSFLAACRQLLPEFAARDFAYCIWALARLDIQPPQVWMDELLVQLRQHIPTMGSSELSATIWALAKLDHKPGIDWMQRFLGRVVSLTQSSSGDNSSNSLDDSTNSSSIAAQSVNKDSPARRRRRIRVSAAAEESTAQSSRVAAPKAPRTPLELSTDFSSIILHGLTMWATARLEYKHMQDCRQDDSMSMQSHVVSSPRSHAHAASSHSSGSSIGSSTSLSSDCQLGSNLASQGTAGVATSVSRDGCIVFHF